MQNTGKPGPPTGAAVEARNRRLGTRPARGDRREPAARPLAFAGWEMAVVASTALAAPGAGRSIKEVCGYAEVVLSGHQGGAPASAACPALTVSVEIVSAGTHNSDSLKGSNTHEEPQL